MDFTPGFIKSTSSGGHGVPRRGGGGGGAGMGGGGGMGAGSMGGGMGGSMRRDNRGPGYSGPPEQWGGAMSRSDQRGGSGGMGGGADPQRRIINITLPQNIQLHTTQNAWKVAVPATAKSVGDLETEVATNIIIIKLFLS